MVLSRKERLLYGALCLNFVVMGMAMTVFSATVPQIIVGFGWTYIATGLVLAANSVGGFVATFASGILLKRFSPKLLLIMGLSATALGLAFFGQYNSPWYNGLLYCLIGAGNGYVEVITNSLVIRMEKSGQSRLMNLMHAGFCSGAVLGPLIVGLLTRQSVPIPLYFLGAGLIQFLAAIVISFCEFPVLRQSPTSPGTIERRGFRDPVFVNPLLWILATILFLYVGVELALSNWVAEFFHRFRSSNDSQAALVVSVYWAGLLTGRIALFVFHRGSRQERMLLILASASLVSFLAAILVPFAVPAAIAVFLTGLAFSGVYPLVMSMVGVGFKNSTAAIGFAATAGGVGLFVFPFATGAIAQGFGLSTALLIIAACDAVLCGTALVLFARKK